MASMDDPGLYRPDAHRLALIVHIRVERE